MRPGALKIKCDINQKYLHATAVKNPDGTIAVAVFNPTEEKYSISLNLNNETKTLSIDSKALQTIILN